MYLFIDEAQISPLLKQYILVKAYVFLLKVLFFSKYSDCRLQTGDEMQTEGKMHTDDCRSGVKCRFGSKTSRFPGKHFKNELDWGHVSHEKLAIIVIAIDAHSLLLKTDLVSHMNWRLSIPAGRTLDGFIITKAEWNDKNTLQIDKSWRWHIVSR